MVCTAVFKGRNPSSTHVYALLFDRLFLELHALLKYLTSFLS